MKVSKATIIRTVMLFIVVLNMILSKMGIKVIDAGENAVAGAVQSVIEILCIAASWWYNNSFTENARKADEYLRQLRDENV